MKPELLQKIDKRWPHLHSIVENYRATKDARFLNPIINAVLLCDVAYLKPSEVLYLSSLRAACSTSPRKSKSSRENGKLGGRPKKPQTPARPV